MRPLTSFLANQTSKHRHEGRRRAGGTKVVASWRGAAWYGIARLPSSVLGPARPYGLVAAVVMIVA